MSAPQARFRGIAKEIHELKQTMREDASTAFFSLTQAAQYVSGDFRGKVLVASRASAAGVLGERGGMMKS